MSSAEYLIEFSNCQQTLPIPEARWRHLLELVLDSAHLQRAEISVAIVDDRQMHQLNRRHLDHDYPTDVLSFILENDEGSLVGEIIVSADTAVERASEFGWNADDELTMYVLHGALHLIGYDDKDPADRAIMREREAYFLERLGMS